MSVMPGRAASITIAHRRLSADFMPSGSDVERVRLVGNRYAYLDGFDVSPPDDVSGSVVPESMSKVASSVPDLSVKSVRMLPAMLP